MQSCECAPKGEKSERSCAVAVEFGSLKGVTAHEQEGQTFKHLISPFPD